ncbi:MAG: ATP-binding cassette domain-containing protein [Chromatiales bacterium]|nr:ATP-binding cassette domain-containing protein [Chromatiales bacterium]
MRATMTTTDPRGPRTSASSFYLRGRALTAPSAGASLDLREGETLAVVGESGSGKSVLAKTFLGMLDQNGRVDSGQHPLRGHGPGALHEGEGVARDPGQADRHGLPGPHDGPQPPARPSASRSGRPPRCTGA